MVEKWHRKAHKTVPVYVVVDVDKGIAEHVRWLNSLPGVRTFASCQGTIGEDGPHPYRAQIMASWPGCHERAILRRFEVGDAGNGWAYLHPRPMAKAHPAKEKTEAPDGK